MGPATRNDDLRLAPGEGSELPVPMAGPGRGRLRSRLAATVAAAAGRWTSVGMERPTSAAVSFLEARPEADPSVIGDVPAAIILG